MKNNLFNTANEIANRVAGIGGRAYYIGGFVRDLVAGIERPDSDLDLDIEVYGVSFENLSILLEDFEMEYVNPKFGAFLLKGGQIEVLLPRVEKSIGCGHKDFDISIEPFLSKKESLSRRDFRMNAILKDVISGEIIDPFDGVLDIQNKIIRHIDSDKFIEDPLRAIRAARFCANLSFEIDSKTMKLCEDMDMSSLSAQLVERELRLILTRSKKPSLAFENLRRMGKLSPWFYELSLLIGVKQNSYYHPEGDVWVHTMKALDCAAVILNESKKGSLPWRVEHPYEFMLLALTHDFGKVIATKEVDGEYFAHGHENMGESMVLDFAKRLALPKGIQKYLTNMISLHMKPHAAFKQRSDDRSSIFFTNEMFDLALDKTGLIYMALADKMHGFMDEIFRAKLDFMKERLELYEKTMAKPHVTGHDLLAAGVSLGKDLRSLLDFSHRLRLEGFSKDEALSMTLSQIDNS